MASEHYKEPLLFKSEDEDDLEVDYLNNITDTVTWSTDWTVESIVNSHRRGSFNIAPGFQRRDAWNMKKKSRFIESLIYGLPIPQIVLAEDKKSRSKYIVVDGKQRLTTLFSFFADSKDNPFELSDLNSSRLNGIDRSKLEADYPDLYNNLLNQSIHSMIIKNWSTENLLYTIFYRLNSASSPLSAQELRKALKPGAFLNLIDNYCSESVAIRNLSKSNIPDPRMRDMDLILRYIVMTRFIERYQGNYKKSLDEICDFYNTTWEKNKQDVHEILVSFEKNIDTAIRVFGDDRVFVRTRKDFRNDRRINRALFDVIVYYFNQIDHKVILQATDAIAGLTNDLCEFDTQFIKAISSNTNNLKEVSTRFVLYGNKLKSVLGSIVKVPKNLEQHFAQIR